MRDAVDVAELDDLVRQQPQRPPRKAFRRVTATQRHQMSFKVPVRFLRVDAAPLRPVQAHLKTVNDEAPVHSIDLPHADLQHAGDLFIRRALRLKLARITPQQDQCVENFLGSVLALRCECAKSFALLLEQRHDVFLHLHSSRVRDAEKIRSILRHYKHDVTLACFISPHGFGHAARCCAIVEGVALREPDLHVEIFTLVPEWFLRESLSIPFGLHHVETDIGLRQLSALEADLDETVSALRTFLAFDRPETEALASTVAEMGCRAVLCDISPLGIEVARRAGVPSVLIENFTWDWIYEGFADTSPAQGIPGTRAVREVGDDGIRGCRLRVPGRWLARRCGGLAAPSAPC